MTQPPSRLITEQELPFGRLSSRDFERLGLGLVIAEGYEKAAHLGAAGADRGIDILTTKNGRTVAFQCKRYRAFGPARAVAAVDEVLKLPAAQRPNELVLLVACDVSLKTREKAAERAGSMPLEVWARTEIEQRLRKHPLLVEQFFGLPLPPQPAAPRPVVTSPPKLPRHFQERPVALKRVESALRAGSDERLTIAGQNAVGIAGMGGIGKSVLAAAAAQDLAAEFPAGVFWVPMGRGADCLALLRSLGDALGVPSANFVSIPQARDRLRHLLAGERVLVVLDDVWTPQAAEALDVVGSPGRQLLTSRNVGLLANLGVAVVHIDVLAPSEAIALLAAWSGRDPAGLPSAPRAVAEECGRLPLALALAGALARKVGRWEDVLDHLQRPDLSRLTAWVGDYPHPNLLRALEASAEALGPQSRERYLELAVFPEGVSVPEAAIANLWSTILDSAQTRELVGELADLSLLRRHADGCVTLHDLQHDYIRSCAGDLRVLHERMVEAYYSRHPEGIATGQNDGWLFHRFAWHLREAGREAELRDLLFSLPWLQARLSQGDGNGTLDDLDLLPGDPAAERLQTVLRQGLHILLADPPQLASQLLGRLTSNKNPSLDSLLIAATEWRGKPWLRPLHPAPPLPPPLYRSLAIDGNLKTVAALDERRLVTASDQDLELWDLEVGERLQSHHRIADQLAVIDHNTIAFRTADGSVGLWDVEADVLSDLPLRPLRGIRFVRTVATPVRILFGVFRIMLRFIAPGRYRWFFSRTNPIAALGNGRLAVGRSDGSIDLLCTKSRRTLGTLPGLLTPAASLESLTDQYLASASSDGVIGVWNLDTYSLVRMKFFTSRVILPTTTRVVGFLDAPFVAVTNLAGKSYLWNWQSGEVMLGLSEIFIRAMIWLDENRLATLSQGSTLEIWDVRKGQVVYELPNAQLGIALTRAGQRFLISAGREGIVRMWSLRDLLDHANSEADRPPSTRGKGRSPSTVTRIVPLADGKAAVMTYDGILQIWDIASKNLLRSFTTGLEIPLFCSLAPDLFAVYQKGIFQVWSLDGSHQDHVIQEKNGYRLIQLESGQVALAAPFSLYVLNAHGDVREIHSFGEEPFSDAPHDIKAVGSEIFYTTNSGDLRCLTIDGTLREVPLGFSAGSFVQLQNRLVMTVRDRSEDDSELAVINPSTPSVIHRWSCHVGRIHHLAAVGSERVASLSGDGTLRVWDVNNGRLVATYNFDAGTSDLAVSPDGSRIVVGGGNPFHVFMLVESSES